MVNTIKIFLIVLLLLLLMIMIMMIMTASIVILSLSALSILTLGAGWVLIWGPVSSPFQKEASAFGNNISHHGHHPPLPPASYPHHNLCSSTFPFEGILSHGSQGEAADLQAPPMERAAKIKQLFQSCSAIGRCNNPQYLGRLIHRKSALAAIASNVHRNLPPETEQ